MCSKLRNLLLICLIWGLASGCSLKLGEKPAPKETIQLTALDMKCFDKASTTIGNYFSGKGDEIEVRAFWDCNSKALIAFRDRVRGKDQATFEIKELKTFLEAYFFSKKEISESLLRELMRVKVLFVGGDVEHLSRDEITHFLDVIEKLKKYSVDLLPYTAIYFKYWQPGDDYVSDIGLFMASQLTFKKFSEEFGGLLAEVKGPYEISSFINLLNELEKILEPESSWNFKRVMVENQSSIEKLKGIFVGVPETAIHPDQWKNVFDMIGRFYGLYLRYYYFVREVDITTDKGWQSFSGFLDMGFTLLREGLEHKPQQSISLAEANQLVDMATQTWSDLSVSHQFVAEIFRLKQLFTGGSISEIKYTDLEKLPELIRYGKKTLQTLMPFVEIYSGEWQSRDFALSDEEKFEAAAQALHEAAVKISDLIHPEAQPYDLGNLIAFLEGLDQLRKLPKDSAFTAFFKQRFNLVLSMKKVLVGAQGNFVTGSQWPLFLETVAKCYTEFLRFRFFISDEVSDPRRTDEMVGLQIKRLLGDIYILLDEVMEKRQLKALSASELKDLMINLTNNFGPRPMESEAIVELLVLKQIFIGGDTESLTRNELRISISFIERMIEWWRKSDRYHDLYLQKLSNGDVLDVNYMRGAQIELHNLARELATQLQSVHSQFDFTQLKTLTPALERWLGKDKTPVNGFFIKYEKLLSHLKGTFFGGSDAVVTETQWPQVLDVAATAYLEYLRFAYVLRGKDISGSYAQEHMQQLSFTLLDKLEMILQSHRDGAISFSRLDMILDDLAEVKILFDKDSVEVLKKTYKPVLSRVFKDLNSGTLATSLNLPMIAVLRSEVLGYFEGQWIINHILIENGNEAGIIQSDFRRLWSIHVREFMKLPAQTERRVVSQMAALLVGTYPKAFDKDQILRFSYEPEKFYMERKDLSEMNYLRVLSRLVLRGYSRDQDRALNFTGLANDEMSEFFEQVKDFGYKTKYIDPRKPRIWNTIFIIGDLFSYDSNGDGILNWHETSELLAFLFSGVARANQVYTDFQKNCPQVGKDYYGRANLSLDCFGSQLREKFSRYFKQSPYLVEYFSALNEAQYRVYLQYLVQAGAYADTPANQVEYGQINVMIQMQQFIEASFMRYDQNHDGILDLAEAMVAYPVFKKTLTDISPANMRDDASVEALFTYLMKYGEPPDGIGDYTKFLWWKYHRSSWQLSVDRLILVKIFSAILAKLD